MLTQKAFKSGSECPVLKPGTLRLYSMRFCPYAQRSRIVLLHKNIPHEIVNINLKEKPEWFLKSITPLGQVPALQKDDVIVYDSSIVCDYLDDAYPENKLNQSSPFKRAKDRMLLEMTSKIMGPLYKLYRSAGDELDKDITDQILSGVEVFENELKNRRTTFFGGDNPMMIDFMLWPHLERLENFVEMFPAIEITTKRFPYMSTWIKDITSVPAVKETILPAEMYKQMMASVKQGNMDIADIGLKE